MRIKLTAVSIATAATMIGAVSTANADQLERDIGYSAELVDGAVVLRTDGGSLSADVNGFRINDQSGRPLVELPLSYVRDGMRWPINATVDGNTATLRPETDPSSAVPAPDPIADSRPATDPQSDSFNNALMRFSTQLNVGVMLGTLIGTAVGAGIGCLVGGIVGAAAGLVATIGVLAIPGFIGGCLATGLVGSTIGAAVGVIAVGMPMAVFGGLLLLDALNQPPAK
ncbi:hypothetical protein [Nocardia sp. NPDC049149]|uniref:hypothetical protein n=1 Tax=Nocardia sp. NPDC049149 TaxID=3364315 RepID=UPI00371CA4D6